MRNRIVNDFLSGKPSFLVGLGRNFAWNCIIAWLVPLLCPVSLFPLLDFSWEHLNKSFAHKFSHQGLLLGIFIVLVWVYQEADTNTGLDVQEVYCGRSRSRQADHYVGWHLWKEGGLSRKFEWSTAPRKVWLLSVESPQVKLPCWKSLTVCQNGSAVCLAQSLTKLCLESLASRKFGWSEGSSWDCQSIVLSTAKDPSGVLSRPPHCPMGLI